MNSYADQRSLSGDQSSGFQLSGRLNTTLLPETLSLRCKGNVKLEQRGQFRGGKVYFAEVEGLRAKM